MKNPFMDFRSVHYQKKEIPLDRIVREKQEIMDRILESYFNIVEEEAKDLVWLVEHSRVVKTYDSAIESIRDLEYDQDDIDEFCAQLDSSQKVPYMISGPAGIYISALVNHIPHGSLLPASTRRFSDQYVRIQRSLPSSFLPHTNSLWILPPPDVLPQDLHR